MREIAIEGLDGAGKSSVARELADLYKAEGLTAQIVAPYRLTEARLGESLFPFWQSDHGAEKAIRALQETFDQARDQYKHSDVIIYDRHWMTAFTEIADRPNLVSEWGNEFVPTAYLRVSPGVAHARTNNDVASPWMEDQAYNEYARRYEVLCQEMGGHLLGIYRNDDDVTPAMIAQSIAWDARARR